MGVKKPHLFRIGYKDMPKAQRKRVEKRMRAGYAASTRLEKHREIEKALKELGPVG